MSATNQELEYKILSQASEGGYDCFDTQSDEFRVAQYLVNRGFLDQLTQAEYQITDPGIKRLAALISASRR